ncbi:MAG: hypothetical protein LBD28_02525 [Tannerellaceae bacterium]|nr:hypothetical protein [Tannerellaceae bacterium]
MKEDLFDREYYVMNIDRNVNPPLLAWGKANLSPFLRPVRMTATQTSKPLSVAFIEPYPVFCRDVDFILFGGLYAGSERMKKFFEKMAVYGVQFVPLSVVNDRHEEHPGYFAMHFWNRIAAVDKSSFGADEPNAFDHCMHLRKFSLNAEALRNVPKKQRRVFMLRENSLLILVHEEIREVADSLGLLGVSFSRVDEWEGMQN